MNKLLIKLQLLSILVPNGKSAFIKKYIPENGKVMDVGCGNNSPYRTKILRSDIYYIGLDIGIYNQSSDVNEYADEFIIVKPEKFHQAIEQYSNELDTVISAHNLEHCNDYSQVIGTMLNSLNRGGYLYLSFPCEDSVHFPSRKKGTLNFYDDSTHKHIISFESIIQTIELSGFSVIFARKKYRPFFLFFLGLLCEPFARITNRVLPYITWALYGFETVIIAKKM
ncbi:MAG: class I SAM-dependent methyltransferase [Tannerellaceae bacterium]|jgi:SAM-dependent methyltransferase|nr:class I SAM-dependent methyltransferase [Tannerellaceae bacterium]